MTRAPVAVLLALLASYGTAHATQTRVSVLAFGGEGGADVNKHVTRVLAKHGLTLVPASAVRAIGAKLPSADAAEVLRTAAAKLHLAAVVMGKVTVAHKKHTLQVVVRGPDGQVLGQTSISAASTRKLTRAVDAGLWKKLAGAFQRQKRTVEEDPFAGPAATPAAPTPAPTPEAAPEPPAQAEAPAEAAPAEAPPVVSRARTEDRVPAERPPGARPVAFEVAFGAGALYRQLTYLSDPEDALSEFRTKVPVPSLAGSLTWFAHMGLPRVGVALSAEQEAPTQALTTGGLEYTTFSGDYFGALLLGFPSRYVTVDLAVGGGRQRYALLPQGDAESRPRPIPNVTYDYLRTGLSLHVYTGTAVSFFAGGYYRHVLGAGVIRSLDWFPSATVLGGEGTAGVSWRINSWLEARLHADVRIYQLHMDPNAGDAHVTDGALDQYWTGGLSFAVLFGATP